jgi:DNA primase
VLCGNQKKEIMNRRSKENPKELTEADQKQKAIKDEQWRLHEIEMLASIQATNARILSEKTIKEVEERRTRERLEEIEARKVPEHIQEKEALKENNTPPSVDGFNAQDHKIIVEDDGLSDEERDSKIAHSVEQMNFSMVNAKPTDTGFLHGIDIRNEHHLILECPNERLKFEIMGGINLKQMDRLRATLKISRFPLQSPIHAFRNTLDFYNDGHIKRYVLEASEKLEMGTTEINKQIYGLIEGIEKYRIQKRAELITTEFKRNIVVSLEDQKEAKKLLESKDLMKQISLHFKDIGLIDEEENGLLLFLIFLTRNFDNPLHALIHGSSGSGKTNLLKTIIKCVPDEQVHITTALTENVLFYPPYRDFWRHKILMLEDLDGSLSALYVLREFMSSGQVSKFTTELDQNTGEHKQKQLVAQGPVCIVGATTKDKIYEDNSNRSYLIHVDETQAHQQNVMNYQNKIAAGLVDFRKIETIQNLLKNAQRMLVPIEVRNPFQPELILPNVIFKPLRTNTHYINLIKSITFLHQHQLKIQKDENGTKFIETKLEHIEWANRLCRESLLRKSDQLSGAQRTFFENLKNYLRTQNINETNNLTFFSKDVREHFKMHFETLKRNMNALENVGLILKKGENRKLSFEYEICYWDDYKFIENGVDSLSKILEDLRETYAFG